MAGRGNSQVTVPIVPTRVPRAGTTSADWPLWYAALRTLGWGSLVLQALYPAMWVASHISCEGWQIALAVPVGVIGLSAFSLPIPVVVHSATSALGVTGRSRWRVAAGGLVAMIVPAIFYAFPETLLPDALYWPSAVLAWAALGTLLYGCRRRCDWATAAAPRIDRRALGLLGLAGGVAGCAIVAPGLLSPPHVEYAWVGPIIYAPFLVAATAGAYGSEVVAKWWARRRNTGEQAPRPDL